MFCVWDLSQHLLVCMTFSYTNVYRQIETIGICHYKNQHKPLCELPQCNHYIITRKILPAAMAILIHHEFAFKMVPPFDMSKVKNNHTIIC